jgi:hypothetical protein
MMLTALTALALPAPAAAVPRGRAVPREILGPEAWRLLGRATGGEVALIERRADGTFQGQHGLAATATATADRRWLGRLRALLRRPGSYFKPRCDKDGRCPQLRCRVTPRAVVTLKRADASAVVVITVCHALRAGPSLEALRPQVSMEPAEGRLLRLLLRLFPKDARLREEYKEWRKLQRGTRRR